MRFRMESRTDFVVLVEIILCVASSSPASFDSHPFFGDNIPPPGYYPRGLSPEVFDPEFYAYSEVNTPFYHYYFYAPAFKTSLEDSHLVQSSHNFSPYKPFMPEGDVYIQRNRDPSFSPNFGNGYISPQGNDVFPNYETSTQSSKPYGNPYLQKPYSTTFRTYEPDRYFQKPTPGLSRSFLPNVLSSGTTNIIRKEDEGRIIHDRMFRPFPYVPSSKGQAPNTVFAPKSPAYKPVLNPSLFSSASPNIIRGEVPSINNLFKPVSTTTKNDFYSSTPNSRPTTYPYVPQSTIRGDPRSQNPYHSFTSDSPSVSPNIFSSTRPPFFQTSELPIYSSPEETLSPLFTSTQTPLEDYPTPGTVDGQSPQVYQEPSTPAPATTQLFFEAPGHAASP